MPRILTLLPVLFLLLLGAFPRVLVAQSDGADSVSVPQLFKDLEERHGITFSYNRSLLESVQLPAVDPKADLESTLAGLSESLSVQFESQGENDILVIPVRKAYRFRVADGESGETLPVVQIQVNAGPLATAVAEEGAFEVTNLFLSDSLKVVATFYQTRTLTVAALRQARGTIVLTPDSVELREVEITSYLARGITANLDDHSMHIDMQQLGLLSGETDGDILQVLQTLPGIRSPNGKPGSLNMRGNVFSQNLTLFDNIPIYHNGHFFGTFSPYNPDVIEEINVHRGTLPARFGGRVGGAIEINTTSEVPDSLSGGVMANTIFGGAHLKVPVIKDKLGLIVSGRSAYPFNDRNRLTPKLLAYSDLNFQGSRITPVALDEFNTLEEYRIRFSDVNARLNYRPHTNHAVSVSALSINNDFKYVFVDQVNQVETTSNTLINWGATANWTARWTEQLTTTVDLTRSEFSLDQDILVVRNMRDTNTYSVTEHWIVDLKASLRANYQLHRDHGVELGYARSDQDVYFDEVIRRPMNPTNRNRAAQEPLHAVFGRYQWQFRDKFIANLGFRTEIFPRLDNVFFDPRISATWMPSKSLSFKASAGRSHQYLIQSFPLDFDDFRIENQFWLLANQRSPVLEGLQAMTGAIFRKSGWLVDLEVYQRRVNNIFQTSQAGGSIFGELETTGADLLVKKKWRWLNVWAGYTLSRTTENFGEEELVFYDQAHVLNTTTLVSFNRWQCSATWTFMSGTPVVDLMGNQPIIEDNAIPNTNTRYSPQHQLDLNATYRFSKTGAPWRGVVGLSLLNVYNRENTINRFVLNAELEDPFREGIGFTPNVQVNVSF